MTYDFDLQVNATLTKDVSESIIKRVIEEQTGKKVATIEWKVKNETVDGCNVTFQSEKATTTQTPMSVKRNQFIVEEYEQVGRI